MITRRRILIAAAAVPTLLRSARVTAASKPGPLVAINLPKRLTFHGRSVGQASGIDVP